MSPDNHKPIPAPLDIILQCCTLAFDETESYTSDNDVFSVLLGDAVPSSSHGTTDGTEYTHYSMLSTVENNWDLDNLGQGDVGAATFF